MCAKNVFASLQTALYGHRETKTEVLGGFSGRQQLCQAPAQHDCITWVNKAFGWDVVFNRGVAPQQKPLITRVYQHDERGWEKISWTKWNLLWQCSGLC